MVKIILATAFSNSHAHRNSLSVVFSAWVLVLLAGVSGAYGQGGGWSPPIGIPTPSFGITETAPAHPNNWQTATPGFYYVNQYDPAATDSSNPYGSISQPRFSIPGGLPAGSVVEIHGLYDFIVGGRIAPSGNGTPSQPIFIRGDGVPGSMSIRGRLIPAGNYQIYENLEVAPGSSFELEPTFHHISFRNNTITDQANGTYLQMHSGLPTDLSEWVEDIVVYNNTIANRGDWMKMAAGRDFHAVAIRRQCRRIWVIDNTFFHCEGDGVQISMERVGNPPQFLYIGRNEIYECQENAVDMKICYDVVVSQNNFHDIRIGGDDPASNAINVLNDQNSADHPLSDRIWIIANDIHACDGGVIIEESTNTYFIGNLVHDIIYSGTILQNSAYGRGSALFNRNGINVTVANNTVYNCDYGFTAIGGSKNHVTTFYNNVISEISDTHQNLYGTPGWHLLTYAVLSNQVHADHNLYYQSNGNIHLRWDPLGDYTTIASFQAGTGEGTGSIQSDPFFTDVVTGNFLPLASSPTLGAGAHPGYRDVFLGLYGIELHLLPSGFALPAGAVFDIGAYESTAVPVPPPDMIFVDQNVLGGANNGTTWANAFVSLADALTSAALVAKAEIWVANGVYLPSIMGLGNPRDATFTLIDDVAIYGGFEGGDSVTFPGGETDRVQRNTDPSTNNAILSGDLGGDDGPGAFGNNGENVYHVVTTGGTNATAVLDGFTITAGNANSFSGRSLGGGIYNIGGSPIVANCLMNANRANADGAGMYNKGDTLIALPQLTNCTFQANETATSSGDGAGLYNQLGGPILTDCVFTLNKSLGNGGGFFSFSNTDPNSWPTLTSCVFSSNQSVQKSGGGAYVFGGGPGGGASFSNCTFTTNMCNLDGGGMRYANGQGMISDCTFTGNDSNNGGGLSIFDFSPVVRRCTFTQNTAVQRGGGIRNSRNDGPIVNCKFFGNIVEQNGGGLHNSNANPTLINCLFSGNKAGNMLQAGQGGAIWNGDATTANIAILNCTLSENDAATSGGGLYNQDNADPIVTNSILWNNRVGGAISAGAQLFLATGTVTVTFSCVLDDVAGDGTVYPGMGNIDEDPVFVDPDGLDNTVGTADDNLALNFPTPASPCTDVGSNSAIPADLADLDDDGDTTEDVPIDLAGVARIFTIIDMGALESGLTLAPPRLFVDVNATGFNNGTSWSNAYVDLGAAVFQAANSQGTVSEIWVATGSYSPAPAGGDRTASFALSSSLRITGGFQSGATQLTDSNPQLNPTILTGDLNGDDNTGGDKLENSYHVLTADIGVDTTGIVEGFTITGGNADGVGQFSQGAGLRINGGSPLIQRCDFVGQTAASDGAAVYALNGNPNFLDCTFSGNTGINGTVFAAGGKPLFGRCTFRNNQVDLGGGIYAFATQAVVMNSYILSNSAMFGGGLYSVGASVEFTNCLFSGNVADLGAGVYSFLDIDAGLRLTNCTLTANTANTTAGGLFNSDTSVPVLANCIIWANSDAGVDVLSAQIFNESLSSATLIDHSCVQDDNPADMSVYLGTGNIDDNPMFVDTDGVDNVVGTNDDNPAPNVGSPVIDLADNAVISPDLLDFDGDLDFSEPIPVDLLSGDRFRNGLADMGAIEFDPSNTTTYVYLADCDGDGDVDTIDFTVFASCFNKSGNPPRTLGCGCVSDFAFDFNKDGDVDTVDFAVFASCFNKSGNLPRTMDCPKR